MNIKWGVIGCGGIADRKTIPGMMLANNAELVAVMDSTMAISEKVREKYGAKYAFDTYEEILALSDVDAVYIASPVNFHKEQAVAAARAKKHILLEKPMALTAADAEEIKNECDKNGVLLSVGFLMRFHSYHQKMKEIISEGKIGEIVSMRSQFTCWYPDIAGAWRQEKRLSGGGALVDLGIHCIDLLQYVSGLRATTVAAINETQTFSYEVDDSSGVLMKMSNGSICYVDSNFNIPDTSSVSKFEIYGTKGSIVARGTLSQEEAGSADILISDGAGGYNADQSRQETGTPLLLDDIALGNMYTKEIEQLGAAILGGGEPPVSAESAIYSQKVIEAAYRSSEKGTFEKV